MERLQTNGSVTLKDVEDGAADLQRVGEALAALRGKLSKVCPRLGGEVGFNHVHVNSQQ